ncbi:UxaA family hydrolase [Notoacmeibacter sp. MSK16QG-6]|uniref:UxaA family hydrolase n=1 Tax=Notoacmeibacter sp. MSK16QG-6 TaxID=2957982 RepID=UPI00209FADE6|nr:UxaA family hydrolase [Notoacmeibacter sp. MSK16QG-6]MCP1199569.1 altronate dehydratase [Notoacmeibacter sp. MSK16QG-6]
MTVALDAAPVSCRDGDNVAVAVDDLSEGTSITPEGLRVATAVPGGHKIALTDMAEGAAVKKNGHIIGWTIAPIAAGEIVHIENMAANRKLPEISASRALNPVPDADHVSFSGFRRADGRIGTRNIIAVLIVGNCAATAARQAADLFDEETLEAYPNVDAVVPFIHAIGCGMEMTGEPMDLLRRTLSGYVRHPNVFGAVVMALGCERNNLGVFLEEEKLEVGERLKTVTLQDVGGVAKAVETARGYIEEMLPEANKCVRETVSAENLVVGLQSSTADGLSGLTVNPVMGRVADLIVASGGTVILSETPEIIGCEAGLRDRAEPGTKAALDDIMDEWQERSRGRDTVLAGRLPRSAAKHGVTTLLERGADALAKQGSSPLSAVRRYAQPLGAAKGLVFMDSPDFDPVSITGQIATGATMILMGTATGSVAGSMPSPTLKLSSTTHLFEHRSAEMDIDCGPALAGQEAVDDIAQTVFAALLEAASGKQTKSEYETMRETEFVPWSIGVLA